MTKRELYDLAKARHRAADRALSEAYGRSACPDEMAKLRHDLDEATKDRRRAFEAYMEEP